MRFDGTSLDGAWMIQAEPVRDGRGHFVRTFCARDFEERGLRTSFVQHSTSLSHRRGTLRGMHFQRPPHAEAKVVSCLSGAIYDVIVDLRPRSPTYLQWQAFELAAGDDAALYVPEGFAHGFQTLVDHTKVGYLISAFYAPEAADGVRYDDPRLGIDWPLPVAEISERDKRWPPLTVGQHSGACG